MKKLHIFFLSCLFIFASSASAAVYKWVDERGVLNLVDDYSKVPPDYRNKVEEMNITRTGPSTPPQTPLGKTIVGARSEEQTAKQPPPIAQPLTREGDFAIRLAEALKIGRVEGEEEADHSFLIILIYLRFFCIGCCLQMG